MSKFIREIPVNLFIRLMPIIIHHHGVNQIKSLEYLRVITRTRFIQYGLGGQKLIIVGQEITFEEGQESKLKLSLIYKSIFFLLIYLNKFQLDRSRNLC